MGAEDRLEGHRGWKKVGQLGDRCNDGHWTQGGGVEGGRKQSDSTSVLKVDSTRS